MLAPLFHADLPSLKATLRLSGLGAGTDADAILESAILTVRTGFYREFGKARVDEIVAMPVEAAPNTDNGIVRATARVTEQMWVRVALIDSMPMLFADASADTGWNDEGAFRDDPSSRETLRSRLWRQVVENFDLLRGNEAIGGETSVLATTFEPDETTLISPGQSAGVTEHL